MNTIEQAAKRLEQLRRAGVPLLQDAPEATEAPAHAVAPAAEVVPLHNAREAAARARLTHFLDEALVRYREERDLPAVEATSRLSPHLALGVVSLREVVHAVWRARSDWLARAHIQQGAAALALVAFAAALAAHAKAPHMAAYAAKTKELVAGRTIHVMSPAA